MAVVAWGCAVINIILNLILIPRFSYIGAAISTIATEAVLFGLYFYFVSKYVQMLPLHRIAAKPMLASAAMGVYIFYCDHINLAAVIVLAVLIYFAILYLTRGFSSEDISQLKEVVRIPRLGRK